MLAIILALGLLAQDAAVTPDGQAVEVAPEPAPEPVSDFALTLLAQLPSTLDDAEGGVPGRSIQAFAMAGREDLIQRFRPDAYQGLAACPILSSEGLDPLIQAARSAQIVIINESHHQPLHRQMIARLGELLADDFDVFAAETFNYLRLEQPLPDGPVGYFAQEPIFARQLALLDATGYRFVAYEARATQRAPAGSSLEAALAARSEAQADNLIAAVLEDDPDARILIHTGAAQVLEAPLPGEPEADPVQSFAYRLKQKTGIDPLSISQVHCAMPAPVEDAAGERDPVADDAGSEGENASDDTALAPPQPGTVFLADPSGTLPDGGLDLALVHAPNAFQEGRPVWRRAIGDTAVEVPVTLRPVDEPVILEVRAPESALRSPPVERLLLYPGDAHPLLLPPGSWVITAWSREGRVGEPVVVEVP